MIPLALERSGRRSIALGRSCAWLAAALIGGCAESASRNKDIEPGSPVRPCNVLLISLCSVRADHLGCYGYPRDTSPGLDAFADQSVLFERAVTQWPKTVPSFAAIHTGLYPHSTGIMRTTPGQWLDDSFTTLAEVFRDAGYRTAAFVSSPALNETVNLHQGFEDYRETFRRPAAFQQTQRSASGWMKIHDDEPFFLWVHFNNAHVPYRPGPDLHAKFVDDEFYDAARKVRINSVEDGLEIDPDYPTAMQISRADLGGVASDYALRHDPDSRPTELDYYVAEYDAAILAADRLIEQLLETLDELGLVDRTLVVVLADHGESLGQHNYYFEHGRLPYESCQHVPLMIRAPGVFAPGTRHDPPVALIDLFPTILELAGLTIPDSVEGRSLVPVALGEAQRGDVFFCAGYHIDFLAGVRRDRWKLVRVSNPMDRRIMTGSEYELYDVVADPAEETNLYDSRPDLAQSLRSSLNKWIEPWWADATASLPPTKPLTLDAETRKMLESIGYSIIESADETNVAGEIEEPDDGDKPDEPEAER